MRETRENTDRLPFQEPELIQPGAGLALEGMNVLIADSDQFVGNLISKLLTQRLGAVTTVVDSGRKAIAEILTGGYDAAVIELILPRTSGIEAIRAIKEMMPDFPILAMSGELTRGREESVRACGVDCLFHKPVRISMLLDELKNIVKTGREKPFVE